MLRKRSRAASKQAALMADYSSIPSSPIENYRKSTSSIFLSPRLFTGFALMGDTESVLSPTSILDNKPFSPLRNPFCSDFHPTNTKAPKSEIRRHWDKVDSRGIGLGIVDELTDELSDPKLLSKPSNRMVLFGSQLKIQIPPPPLPSSIVESPKSTGDFGIKTRNSQKSPFGSGNSGQENLNSPRVFTGSLSASEMELSEDYTRVISYGLNPKTTHIFDNCIVERCCGVVGISPDRKRSGFCGNRSLSYPSESFLSFCYNCKKNLGQGKDIYMYRGERAFCSRECRHKEMMLEEGMGKMESDDHGVYGTFP